MIQEKANLNKNKPQKHFEPPSASQGLQTKIILESMILRQLEIESHFAVQVGMCSYYDNPHYIDIRSKLDLRSGDKEDKDKEKRSLEARGYALSRLKIWLLNRI